MSASSRRAEAIRSTLTGAAFSGAEPTLSDLADMRRLGVPAAQLEDVAAVAAGIADEWPTATNRNALRKAALAYAEQILADIPDRHRPESGDLETADIVRANRDPFQVTSEGSHGVNVRARNTGPRNGRDVERAPWAQ